MSESDIRLVNEAFERAALDGDADAMAAVYTNDAIVLPPDGPVVEGKENIKALWGSVLSGMGLKTVKLDSVNLEIAGDTACEVGLATLGLEPPGDEPTTVQVKFVVYWKRDNGDWRWHRDIWNATG